MSDVSVLCTDLNLTTIILPYQPNSKLTSKKIPTALSNRDFLVAFYAFVFSATSQPCSSSSSFPTQ